MSSLYTPLWGLLGVSLGCLGVYLLGIPLWGIPLVSLWGVCSGRVSMGCVNGVPLGVSGVPLGHTSLGLDLGHTSWVALWGVLWVGWSYLLGIVSPASGVVTL